MVNKVSFSVLQGKNEKEKRKLMGIRFFRKESVVCLVIVGFWGLLLKSLIAVLIWQLVSLKDLMCIIFTRNQKM